MPRSQSDKLLPRPTARWTKTQRLTNLVRWWQGKSRCRQGRRLPESVTITLGSKMYLARRSRSRWLQACPWTRRRERISQRRSQRLGSLRLSRWKTAGLKNKGLERLRDWRMKRHRRCCMENRAIFGSTARRAWISLDVWMKSQQFSTHRCPH